MTAAELIEELKKLPPDTKVYTHDMSYGVNEIEGISTRIDYIYKGGHREKMVIG